MHHLHHARAQRAALFSAVALLALAAPSLAQSSAPSAHHTMVERGSKAVMPFDLSRSMHMFEPTADGGVQTVMSSDGDARQVALIRSHLRKEAAAFSVGDFSDPAHIHGANMPGLAQLRAGGRRIHVRYSADTNGASIRYRTADPKLVIALHRWFAAQVADHGAHAMMLSH